MARIRTIKPEFFRHELLQDLEIENPGKYVMLFFIGLLTLCDKSGRFIWNPRAMKLDILPYIGYFPDASLMLLWENGLIKKYEVDGKSYGVVVNFEKHQRISGKELSDPNRYPEPIDFISINTKGSTREALGKQLVAQEKEKEKEKEKERECTKKTKSIKKTTIDDNFSISESVYEWYSSKKYSENIKDHFDSFIDKCKQNGYSYVDWDAALKTAIRDDWAKLRNLPYKTQLQTKQVKILTMEEVLNG